MHAKVISKIRCYSPNSKNTPVKNYNTLYYIATRTGVDLSPLGNENGLSSNDIYARYIHERPQSHGLFGNIDTSDVNKICADVRDISKSRVIYRGILSLSEDDASELGFLNKKAWSDYLTLSMPEIAETLGIPASDMNWIAAFHKQQGHPHVHYMLWSSNPHHVQTPFISIPQQHKCRELFSGRFFAEERNRLIQQKYKMRNIVTGNTKDLAQTELQKIVSDVSKQPSFRTLYYVNQQQLDASSLDLLKLASHLPKKGRINYAFLPESVKQETLQVVQNMLSKPELKMEYDAFLDYHAKIAETYSPTESELRIAVLKGKEDIDRRLANIVLDAAQRLRKEKDVYYALLNTRLPSYQSLLARGISQDTIDSLHLESQSKNAQASYILARIYDDANSDFYDPEKALHFYQEAADLGNSMAKSILGGKYLWGKDVDQNVNLGKKYLREAQEAGNTYAKDIQDAYDSFQKENSKYAAFSLMKNLLKGLCWANHTKCPSSVYQPESVDRNNSKALKEMARKHPHKKNKEIEL